MFYIPISECSQYVPFLYVLLVYLLVGYVNIRENIKRMFYFMILQALWQSSEPSFAFKPSETSSKYPIKMFQKKCYMNNL